MDTVVIRRERNDDSSVFHFPDDPEPYRKVEGSRELYVGYSGSVRGQNGRKRNPTMDGTGRYVVAYSTNTGVQKRKNLHRLIALSWLEPPVHKDTGEVIPYDNVHADHIDSDENNDTVPNCRWLLASENCRHSSVTKSELGQYQRTRRVYKWFHDDINEEDHVTQSQNPPKRRRMCGDCRGRVLVPLDYPQRPDYEEEFRDVVYEGRTLRVSNHGRVMTRHGASHGCVHGSYLVSWQRYKRSDGRMTCRPFRIHHMVILAFVGDRPSPEYTVDHIDRNNFNNCLHNLRWASPSEQTRNTNRSQRYTCHSCLSGEKEQEEEPKAHDSQDQDGNVSTPA